MFVLYFDGVPVERWNAAIKAVAAVDVDWVAWATRSHYASRDLVHVHLVVPLSRPVVNPAEYDRLQKRLTGLFIRLAKYGCSRDTRRRWTVPSRPIGIKFGVQWRSESTSVLDVDAVLTDKWLPIRPGGDS